MKLQSRLCYSFLLLFCQEQMCRVDGRFHALDECVGGKLGKNNYEVGPLRIMEKQLLSRSL